MNTAPELTSGRRATAVSSEQHTQPKRIFRSIFELPSDFFDSCRLLESSSTALIPELATTATINKENNLEEEDESTKDKSVSSSEKWTCNTCKSSFESLLDQRSHFKSDFHRINVKLTVAGKDTVKEDDFDEWTSDSLVKDFDISSISGSEDEDDRETSLRNDTNKELLGSNKRKIFVQLSNGEIVSLWKSLFLDDTVKIIFEHSKSSTMLDDVLPCVTEREMTVRLRYVAHEPRDNTHFRVMLLASGGHFAGCVFDGNSVVAHKTFHRYVIRAKAGKKQSSKDASGKIAHSAGASIRRHNELALKKDIRELLAAWKPYFEASSCIFIHAPSDNRQLLFEGETPYFSCQKSAIRRIPLTVRRPTFKEAKRLYNILTQVSPEPNEETVPISKEDSRTTNTHTDLPNSSKTNVRNHTEVGEASIVNSMEDLVISSGNGSKAILVSTPLHEAAKDGNVEKVLELLEQGSDPCVVDERGKTPYMLATEKEVRNTFRRFMALNLDKWDWHAAKVPSPLTKEMEESQNAKQAEKDAKRKARAKELKKARKAREKKAEAEAAQSQNTSSTQSQSITPRMTKEEELKRAQDEEREKRAAAAERRIAALQSQKNTATSSSDSLCSYCQVSLAGKVPFHRYNYKYCSTSCMHVHREILEDE
ncbi:putative transcription factor C2H2 family [Helianthus annuus]|uniref:Putative zinc finger protein-related protein n=1 Tax=Helianthus annuus TaxID=4232 RepID=A0A251V210_HELAN|nr:ankyrin repeat and zinc finger domain-containing protein 1 [Helianthus annuus]KAF5811736.1 putative transcription factor C2H2 family [Helianthus annuus]KAJ0758958.1 putative transcription factor C2H2 family [Helianthus annuus]KAJ0928482.1 putative transcription factor C2H2 family [Helianthus annuus]